MEKQTVKYVTITAQDLVEIDAISYKAAAANFAKTKEGKKAIKERDSAIEAIKEKAKAARAKAKGMDKKKEITKKANEKIDSIEKKFKKRVINHGKTVEALKDASDKSKSKSKKSKGSSSTTKKAPPKKKTVTQ